MAPKGLPRSIYIVMIATIVSNAVVTYILFAHFLK